MVIMSYRVLLGLEEGGGEGGLNGVETALIRVEKAFAWR